MSELTMFKKAMDFAQIASETKEMNSHLKQKREFVHSHFQSTKALIQHYYNNIKSKEHQIALSKDIAQLIASIKGKNDLLAYDMKYLQSLETESKAKLLSSHELRVKLSNENTERFLLVNCLKEKEAFHNKMKDDLDNLKTYSYFREFKRDIHVTKTCCHPFSNDYDQTGKKQSKKRKKKETQLELYQSTLNQALKELKAKKHQKRIDDGFIWKIFNEKYNSDITVNMSNISSDSISNCSSDSNDLFSIDEFDSDIERTSNSYSNTTLNKQLTATIPLTSKTAPEKDKDILISYSLSSSKDIQSHSLNSQCIQEGSIAKSSVSMEVVNDINDEIECKSLKEEVSKLRESIKASQRRITLYQQDNKKLKDQIAYLQLKISFSDFGMTCFESIKRSTFNVFQNSVSFQQGTNEGITVPIE